MSDVTEKGGKVVALYTTGSAGRNSPRPLQGDLMVFVDKQFFAGVGKHRVEIPSGTRFVVTEVWAGWKLWQGGKIAEIAVAVNGHYPQRHELGHTDESAWAPGLGGRPSDPWQISREVALTREVDLTEYTFCTSTGGGRAAVDTLRRSMQNANLLRPNQLPIIELAWRPMHTDYGTKSKPDLKILGWWRPEQTTLAPPDNDLSDAIPDLTK